jgi:F-type H+-transporting ATPase subunit epsilon
METTFELEVATPERLLVREHVTEAQIPLANGYIGVLAGHAPLLGALGTGALSYVAGGRRRHMVVVGGWVEVLGGHVRVLADTAEHADEIDVRRAEEALRRASERLLRAGSGVDVARALNALRRAQARLETARRR